MNGEGGGGILEASWRRGPLSWLLQEVNVAGEAFQNSRGKDNRDC